MVLKSLVPVCNRRTTPWITCAAPEYASCSLLYSCLPSAASLVSFLLSHPSMGCTSVDPAPSLSFSSVHEPPCSSPPVVAAELESYLLRTKHPFPYFFLVALEAGSFLRAIALLLAYPLAWLLQTFAPSQDASLKLLVFISCAGLRLADVECVGRAVLPPFFAKDVRARAWKTFSSFPTSRRFLISGLPRPMLDSFACNQLGAHQLIAPDLHVTSTGRCIGFLKPRRHLANTYGHPPQLLMISPTISHKYLSDLQLISSLKMEQDEEIASMADLQNPVIFHDGRLVQRPTPTVALLVFLWMPVGFILALLRVLVSSRAPYRWWATAGRLFGIRIIVKGKIPARSDRGLLLVSNHRTLMDPIFVSIGLARPVTAVTYSVSRLSEILSPISTARLQRDAEKDLQMLKRLIKEGKNVVVCPEGTTSREEMLLRFSALFAEVTDNIVPVAVRTRAGVFHGTTARGWKAMDPFFFMMNPSPTYELNFLDKLPAEMTCGAGHQSRYDVANYVQQLIASTLNYQCSSYTRPDKYRFLAGTDGSVFSPPNM